MQKEANPKTLIERGRAFGAVGDFTRAEEYFASALDQGADAREVLPLLMDVCIKTGRFRSAIQYGEDHIRKHPNDHQTRVMVGALYAGLNEGPQATVQLEPVAKEPDAKPALRAQAHYLLAVVARDDLRDVVATDAHFREYLRLDPNGPHVEEAKAALLVRVIAEPEGTDAGTMPRKIEPPDGG